MTDHWQKTIKYLALTRPAVTQLLDGSSVHRLGEGVLTVHVSREGALYHLGRIGREVNAAASQAWGQPLQVEFVNGAHLGVSEEITPAPEAAQLPAVGNLALMDLLARPIWVKHPRYLTLFYQPYFLTFSRFAGPRAFPLWQFLRDRVQPDREYKNAWTPVWEVLLKDLAEMTGFSAQQMTGCWRPCAAFDKALRETGQPIPCCLKQGATGRRTADGCNYWAAGVFQLLIEHGLAVIHVVGTASRNTRYALQVYRRVGLLTPWQVERLPADAQRAHQFFLTQELGIDYELWRQIETVSLVRLWRDDTGLGLATEGAGVLNATAFKNFFLPSF